MTDLSHLAKILIIIGSATIFLGVLVFMVGKLPWIGKLPGDILVRKGNFTFYFPLATSIVLSLVISLIMYLVSRR